jgi:RNA polymerase sigma-70 factor (ECF subfamily)
MTTAPDPLDALVEGVVAGRNASFRALYDETADGLAGFAYRMLGDRHAAEDAVQQAFLELARSAGRFRGDGRALRAWLYRSVRFSVMDELRRRRRRPEQPSEILPETPVTEHADHGWDPELEEALGALPERQRAVLLLWHVDGFEPAEIARILGTTRGAVYAAAARGEVALRSSLRVESGAPTASEPGEG